MPILQLTELLNGPRTESGGIPEPSDKPTLLAATEYSSLDEELDVIVGTVKVLNPNAPDLIMSYCMAAMARCTEIYLQLIRLEGSHRKAKVFRTSQLQMVMDLLDFQFKGASRLIEVRRQEVELSK